MSGFEALVGQARRVRGHAIRMATGGPFTVEQIVTFLDEHPEIRAINQCHGGTSWMTKHASQLKTVHLGTLKGFPARSDAQVP